MAPSENRNNPLVDIDERTNADSSRIRDKGSVNAPGALIALAFDCIASFI